jgi:hypothetical protein
MIKEADFKLESEFDQLENLSIGRPADDSR